MRKNFLLFLCIVTPITHSLSFYHALPIIMILYVSYGVFDFYLNFPKKLKTLYYRLVTILVAILKVFYLECVF